VTLNSEETFNGLVPAGPIDIKPRANPNSVIDLKNDRELNVAIVGAETFDALQVDPATIKFGPIEAGPVNYNVEDYNRDVFLISY